MDNSRTRPLCFIRIVNDANIFHESTLSDMEFPFRKPFGATRVLG